MTWRRFIRPGDWVAAGLAIAVTAASGVVGGVTPESAHTIVARIDGVEEARWELPGVTGVLRDTLAGPIGATVVEATHAGVRVVSAPCSDRWCMHDGDATADGGVIICAPNRLVIRAESATGGVQADDGTVDAITH